jgi:signal transduction histidine kinase
MRWIPRVPTAVRLRVALGVSCLLLAFVAGSGLELLPWVLLVVTLDICAFTILGLVKTSSRARENQGMILLCLAAVSAGLALVAGPISLVLLLIPAYHAGERLGHNGTAAVIVSGFIGAFFVAGWDGDLSRSEAADVGQWSATAMALGILGTWASSLRTDDQPRSAALAAEASALLRRLHDLSDALDTGFDPPATAEQTLADLETRVPVERSAILVGSGGDPAIPMGLRGTKRVPWPEPTVNGSLLAPAWDHGGHVAGKWQDPAGGVRAVLAVPLEDVHGQRIAVLVADRPAREAFTDDDVEAAREVAMAHSPFLDAGLVFDSLRVKAGLEERERLAREMHDGIAQELAALGFEIDAVRAMARSSSSPLVTDLEQLRTSLGSALSTLRLQISDLRMAGRMDTSLGAILSSRLQLFGASTGFTTTMEISETGFRLPAHLEVMLYRVVLEVLSDARRSRGTTFVRVSVHIAAPTAFVEVVYDGDSSLTQLDFANHPLLQHGAELVIEPHPAGRGTRFHARVHMTDDLPIPFSDQRMVSPA